MIYANSDRTDRPSVENPPPPHWTNVSPPHGFYVSADDYRRPRRPVNKALKYVGYVIGGLFVLGMIGSAMEDKPSTPAPAAVASVSASPAPKMYVEPPSTPKPSQAPVDSLRPCEHEDSAGPCFWDAGKRGDGQGRSFIVTAEQQVVYLDDDPVAEFEKPTAAPPASPTTAPRLGTVRKGHECVLQTSEPRTYAIVSDTDPMCLKWWSNGPTSPPATAPFDPIKEWENR